MSLFRKEAVFHQSERLTGAISLAQPLSLKLTVLLLVAVALIIVVFLFNAEYSRKETVRGFLTPSKGMIKTFATRGGTIERLWVEEGDVVDKGQPLVSLVVQQNNADGVTLSARVVEQLNAQVELLNEEIAQHLGLQATASKNLTVKERALGREKLRSKIN